MKNKPTRWIFPLLILFLNLPVLAQVNLKQAMPVDPQVKVGKLPNGLTYYIRKNVKPEKKVELRLVVNAGSVLEDNDQLGLAHFMEHMGFNGSANFPKNELVNYLQQVGVKFGADLNAYTSFDETVYILPIPTDKPEVVEKGFTVLEDWAFNNMLDTAEIEKERGIVLEESRLNKGAGERMRRQYFPKLMNGSQYAARLPIGKDSILSSFSPATLERFYRQWYRPDLMAVMVVGDLDPAQAEKMIKAHFGKFKNPAKVRPRPAAIPIRERTKPEALVVTDGEATNAAIQIYNYVRPRKKVHTWGDYREKMVESLLTTLINERLQLQTQKENPPFVFAFTGIQPFLRGYETFQSYAVLGNGTAQEAVAVLIAETERVRKYGFLPSELARAKAGFLNNAERSYNERDKSESANLVGQYVNNFLNAIPIPGIENHYRFLKQVLPGITVNEINALAKKMPGTTHAFTLITAPEMMKETLPGNEDLLKAIVAAQSSSVVPYVEKAIAGQLLDKAPVPGKIVGENKNENLGTIDLTLSNGITVTLKPTTYKNDQILMDAWRWGGYHKFALVDKDNARNAATVVRLMGVKDLGPTDLKRYLTGKTVQVYPYINPHEEGIEGSSSVKDLEAFFQLTYLYFTQPRKDEALFKSYINKEKGYLQNLKKNPQMFYSDTLSKILYNNNPWISGIPTEKELDQLNLNKAFSIYQQLFSNAHGLHFTFVGNIDPATMKPLLEKYLGSLPASPQDHTFKDNGIRPVKGLVEVPIKKGREAQSVITLQFTGETEYSQLEKLKFNALLEVLNIKVTEKLREEMGNIYGGGFRGNISRRPYTGYTITASIPCGPENVAKLNAALLDLIQNTQQKGIDPKDLDKVKETWKKQYRINLQSNDFWNMTLSSAWIDRDDPEEVLAFEKRVAEITAEDIQRTAQKYLNLDNYVKTVLYPEEAK